MKSECVLFWREYEAHGYLSQWYKVTMDIDGVEYNCCEQYMMAEKARVFDDEDTLKEIMNESDPFRQKKLGRKVKNFDPKKWDQVCRDVVYRGNLAKFTQNPGLRRQFLATGDQTLVEASPFDKIWGIGRGPDDPKASDPTHWRGKNLLGEALMKVRSELA